MSQSRYSCTVLASAVLVASALCGAAGVASAQEWKAYGVPLFVSASNASGHQGFVRVINRSDEAGDVLIDAIDDIGVPYGPVTLDIGARETVHFNSGDLEFGSVTKGLSGGIGAGTGNWRLRLRSDLDLEVLAYNRTGDGLLAPLHDVVPRAIVRRPGTDGETMGHRVAIFNPASNVNQVSRLRIINPGEEEAAVTIEGIDDDGASPGTAVEVSVLAGASRTITSQALESGQGDGLAGMLDDGEGKWQLVVTADQPVEVMSLLTSPTGHLTNLSTAPEVEEGGSGGHDVPLFAAVANPHGYQGFVRIINHSGESGEVSVEAFDEEGMPYGPVTLDIEANETVHFNSGDLEEGNADKGLSEGVGEGSGDWRLRLRSDLDLGVLAYNRTHDGLLTTMHDLVPYTRVMRPGAQAREEGHVAIFNPASNTNQVSRLRVINPGTEAAAVTIEGIDDAGASPGPGVELSVPAGTSRTLTARELESGEWAAGSGVSGRLGDGQGKWRLVMTSDTDIRVMSLLANPTGHLVNLSTAAPEGEVVPPPVVPTHAAIEITSRTTASTRTPVALSVESVGTSDIAIERYEWVFSDGQRRSGEEVSVSFADAGVHEVTVSAMSGTDVVAQATWAVAVFDAAAGANPGFAGIPTLFGDVTQDARFGPEDLELAEQAVAGLAELEVEAIEAGDVDLSGGLAERDVELMRQALDSGAALPSALLDTHAYPGGAVAMVSPALQDPDADIEVYVDGVPSPQVMRAILGYATFVVPPSLAGEDAEVDVVVEANGVVAERLRLVLKPVVIPEVDAREDVLAFLGELAALVAGQQQAGAEFIEQNGGLSAEDTAIVLGAAKAAARRIEVATAEIEAVLNREESDELATLVQAALYANGLAEFRAQARTDQSTGTGAASQSSVLHLSAATRNQSLPSVFDVCSSYVPAVCALKESIALHSWGSAILMGICVPGPVTQAVFGALDAPDVRTFATNCASVVVAMHTATALGTIVNAIGLGMRLTSDKNVLQGEEDTATITTEVTFSGLRTLCGPESTERINERIEFGIQRIARIIVTRSYSLTWINRVNQRVSSPDFLVREVAGILGTALSLSGFYGRFERALGELCDLLGTGRVAGLMADARQFKLKVSNGGVLLRNDRTGTYRLACPEGFTGTLEVTGNKDLCGDDKKGMVRVACREPCPVAANGEVNIPDAGLRAAVDEALGKPAGAPITRDAMASLRSLDAGRRGISSLAGLECTTEWVHLYLHNNQLSDISPLSDLTALEALYLHNNQLSDISPLSDLTALQRLYLHNNQLSDISPLSGLTALQTLYLDNNQLSDISPLSGLTALEGLYLHNNQLSDISPLSDLTALEALYLNNNQLSDISPLSGLTALRWLGLGNSPISDISPLSGLTALQTLGLDNNQLSDISPLSGLTALRWLGLGNNPISDISPLSGLTALELLTLGNSQLSDISPLSDLTALEGLYLESSRISDVSPLSSLTALEALSLVDNQIWDIGPLVSNAGLGGGDVLWLWGNPLRGDRACSHVLALQRRGVTVSHHVAVWAEEFPGWKLCGDSGPLLSPNPAQGDH